MHSLGRNALLALLIVVGLTVVTAPATASATRIRFNPVGERGHHVVYRPHGVRPTAIRRAHVRMHRHGGTIHRRIRVGKVRRALRAHSPLRLRKRRSVRGGVLRVSLSRSSSHERQPTPTPPNCDYGTFGANSEPGACWRPYSDSSPFNTPIGSSTQVSSNSAQVVNRLVGFGSMDNTVAGTGGTGADWMHPIYFSQPSDPLYTIHCTVSSGQCPTLNGMQLRIPSAAQPAGAGDGHMAVIDQSSGWEWDFWQVQSKPAGGGTLTVSSAGRTMITGDGLKSGATASYFGLAAGVIRGEEMQAGEIDHALFLVVKCTNGTAVWPAATSKASGRSCSSMGLSNANAPAMGQHFYLEMSDAQINALMVPSWQKTILRAMAHYGMYVGDTGGSSWGVQIESGTSYTSFGETDPWVTFAKQAGVPTYQSSYGLQYVFKWSQAVDWRSLLRTVTAPGV